MSPMARGGHGKPLGGRKASGPGIRRLCVLSRGGRKLGGGGGGKLCNCGGRIEAHGGQIEGGRGKILVRGRRIGRTGFCVNSQGEFYALDSEDEGAEVKRDAAGEGEDMVVEGEDVAAKGEDMAVEAAAAMEGPAAVEVLATGVPAVVVVVTDVAPAVEVVADRALGVELALEVQARLEVVILGIDPVYHAVFIGMYKVMVPAFFKSH